MKNFQIVLIVIFITFAVLGLLVFSGAIPLGNDNSDGAQGSVTAWGTIKNDAMATPLEEYNAAHPSFIVKYVQKNPQSFDQDLLEALASGTGPDLIFLPDDLAFHYRNKILAIPYQSYPLSSFQKNFAQSGEVFLAPSGILAFPLTIDPLVMYYNRSILDANGVVSPPATWDELIELVPKLTKRDESNKINKSAVSLGHYSNVFNAKDILSTLFMQAGNKIVLHQNGNYVSGLNSSSSVNLDNVLQFYTDFSDPQKNIYSWNKSLPLSRDFFSADRVAFYFGHASELTSLVNRNPNLNFLVSEIPQIKNSTFKLTSARVTGIAVLSSSKNVNTAFVAASGLSSEDFARKLANNLRVVPARRDLLAIKPNDAYSPTFYSSGLYARSWLDPSIDSTDAIFRNMIDSVLSNTLSASSAILDAHAKLSLLLSK